MWKVLENQGLTTHHRGWLHTVQATVERDYPSYPFKIASVRIYFFKLSARNITVRFQASAASAAR